METKKTTFSTLTTGKGITLKTVDFYELVGWSGARTPEKFKNLRVTEYLSDKDYFPLPGGYLEL